MPLRGFGDPGRDDLLRVKFPELAVAVNAYDRIQAGKQFKANDSNNDGIVTDGEWRRADVYSMERFHEADLDGDEVLTKFECSLGWVKKRLARSKVRRTTTSSSSSVGQSSAAESIIVTATGAKVTPEIRSQADQLARHLMQTHDLDDDNIVQRSEYRSGRSLGDLSGADRDGSGFVTRGEIADWLLGLLPGERPNHLAFELQERDADKDGQVSLAEFAPDRSADRLGEFALIDLNDDGLITPRESTAHEQMLRTPTTYSNDEMMVLLEYGVVVSEIQISDDITIGDIDVCIGMSKREDNYTKIVLLTPDNKAIDLFDSGWAPWRSPVFHNTLIDDDAMPITRPLSTPPLRRAIQPPGVKDNERRSLNDLVGTSTRGRWRLVLRNQNDYEGLLRSWSLVVTPEGSEKVDVPAKREFINGRVRVTQ